MHDTSDCRVSNTTNFFLKDMVFDEFDLNGYVLFGN